LLFHGGPIEGGLSMHLDLTSWGSFMFTTGLAMGVAVP
jgi:hypothetical protein